MRGRFLPVLSILSIFGVLFMVNFTTPPEVGVIGVLVFFTMIFILLFSMMVGLIKVFQKILSDKNGTVKSFSDDKVYMYAVVLSFGPLMLLIAGAGASSLSPFNVILIIIFMLLSCFLIHKRA